MRAESLRPDWPWVPLGDIATKIQDGTHFSPQTTSGPRRYLTSKNIRFGHMDISNSGWISESEHQTIYRRCDVKQGDILLTKDGANTGNAALNMLAEEFSLLSSVAIIRLDQSVGQESFLLQYLLSFEGQRRMQDLMSGNAIRRLTLQKIRAFKVPLPPLPEQHRIAEILDTLDEAIRKTEQVIHKLQQMKQGLLHDLLTRGIDENGELRDPERHPEQFKDSPLGRIPRGWEVEPLSAACTAIADCPHSTPVYLEEGVLVARTMHIRAGRYDEEASSRVTEKQYRERIARLEPRPGDVVFTREAPVGQAFTIPRGMRICLGQRVMVLRPLSGRLLGEYLVAQVYSGAVKRRIGQLTGGTTNPHLNVKVVKAFPLPLPPMVEQVRITETLSSLQAKLDQEIGGAEKLRTIKKGLMDDLLTGRVRVTVPEVAS